MSSPIITKIQVENNDVVSFLNDTTYIRSMSQILQQNPTYISYRYDSITISQVAGEAFTFTVYTITDVGGNAFLALTSLSTVEEVQTRTAEIYRLLVTSIFKGCCECGDTLPECSIQYTAGDATTLGRFQYDGSSILFNYVTGNNQDFTGFFPIVQDGSWVFIFSKTDPTVYAVVQLSNFVDNGTYCKFDAIELNANGVPFVDGTQFCIDFTSVGGSLVQGWQDTLDINSTLDKDNTVDGAGYNFTFDNNASFVINSAGGSIETNAVGASINAGAQQVTVTAGYVDIITPLFSTAATGWVLAKDASGHVEYVEAGTGTISSIELIMPPAFTVSDPNPLITDGTFTVTVDGTDLQYINGLGELATLPTYTVENGLHPKEGPDPYVFHLGGTLLEDTPITTTNGLLQYQLSVVGTANQSSQFPFGVANLGIGGVATFQDYGSGFRPNPTVEVVGDVDLSQPLLELRMEGNLPAGGPLDDRTAMLLLKYAGDAANNAATSIDYQFRNNAVTEQYVIGGRLETTLTSYVEDEEYAKFTLQLVGDGTKRDKIVMEGKGQLTLNEYAGSTFWGTSSGSNINNSLSYVLGVDNTGKVWKTSAGTGTVTSIDVNGGTGISVSPAGPITTSGTFTVTNTAPDQVVSIGTTGTGLSVSGTYPSFTLENTAPDQVVILNEGTNVTITGTYPEFTINADGGGATYNGDQGVYKDTSLDPDTFMLGAPSGSQSTIPFTINRYISVANKFLQMEGSSYILKLKEGAGVLTNKPSTLSVASDADNYAGAFTAQNNASLLVSTSGTDVTALEVNNSGTGADSYAATFQTDEGHGISVNSTTNNIFQIDSASPSSIDNIIDLSKNSTGFGSIGQGISISLAPGSDAAGSKIINGTILNSIVSNATHLAAFVDFRIDTLNLGSSQSHTTFKGSGQLQLNNYTTSTSFAGASGASVGVLNVDNTGKVFVGTGGGGGGGLTSVGLTMPTAFTVTNSPLTADGTIGVSLGGSSTEYLDGTGNLQTLPIYTADSGLTPTPTSTNFQLGGLLLADANIDGDANTYSFTTDNLSVFSALSQQKATVKNVDGSHTNLMSLLANESTISSADGTSGTSTYLTSTDSDVTMGFYNSPGSLRRWFKADTAGLYAKTPNVDNSTAVNSQVLTLVDETTGRMEWATPASGGVGLEAVLMLMGA